MNFPQQQKAGALERLLEVPLGARVKFRVQLLEHDAKCSCCFALGEFLPDPQAFDGQASVSWRPSDPCGGGSISTRSGFKSMRLSKHGHAFAVYQLEAEACNRYWTGGGFSLGACICRMPAAY